VSQETLGARLRGQRLGRGWSQTQLANRSGIPKSRISRYENDHLLPSIPTLERLAAALGVAEASLLTAKSSAPAEFISALEGRGIRLGTPEQARELAHRCADLLEAAGEAGAGLMPRQDG
jgi:transcriptional regulator with XRE-family HTH domain